MKNLNKHLIAITSKAQRLILKGVSFDSSYNTMTVTDSHRLLEYKAKNKISSDMVIDIETMEFLEGEYPKTKRLFPKDYRTLKFSPKQVSKELINELTKNKKYLCKVSFLETELRFEFLNNLSHDANLEGSVKIEKSNTQVLFVESSEIKGREVAYFNSLYLRDMFRFISDYEKDFKEENELEILYTGKVRPLTIKGDNFKYLVTPVRTSKW